MFTRVKQVVSALTAHITDDDRRFIKENLNSYEQILFWRMNVPDQRHTLNAAYTALNLIDINADINYHILVKSVLLHDVGKVRGDVSTIDKIVTVIAHKFAPDWARRWGRPGRGNKLANIRHAFYIYFNHAERSAAMLGEAGTEQAVIDIVRKHHKTPADDDPPELTILRMADNLN